MIIQTGRISEWTIATPQECGDVQASYPSQTSLSVAFTAGWPTAEILRLQFATGPLPPTSESAWIPANDIPGGFTSLGAYVFSVLAPGKKAVVYALGPVRQRSGAPRCLHTHSAPVPDGTLATMAGCWYTQEPIA
jgi:hypothetical protein